MKFKVALKLIFPILASFFVFVFFSHDSFLYHEPVGKIVAVKTVSDDEVKDVYQNVDRQITQELTIQLLNQNHQTVRISNTATESQTMSQLYQVGQQVLLDKEGEGAQIVTLKRDALIAATFTLFLGFLISFIRWKASIFLVLSIILNLFYFIIAVGFDINFNISVFVIFTLLSILFAASSLFFVLGVTRQMLYTFLTTILTTALTFALTFVVLNLTNDGGIHFEYLSYVTQDPEDLFFIGSIISVLGAIMDGTGDIVVGLFGLYRQDQLNHLNKSFKDYLKVGISIGQEIIGTLTNVLFMIFMAEAFPITLLLLRNGNDWGYIATVGLNLGLLQTVISAIGIALAVPVTAFVTSFGMTHRGKDISRLQSGGQV